MTRHHLATRATSGPRWLHLPVRMIRRARQAADAMCARASAADDARYTELIGDTAWAVAQHLSAYDRLHHLRVYDWLLLRSERDADLLHAALLHDIGKVATGVRVTILHRALHVVAMRLPGTRHVLGRMPGLGAGLQVLSEHPQRGADLAATFGASDATVQLIARHHDAASAVDDRLLRALREADQAVGA